MLVNGTCEEINGKLNNRDNFRVVGGEKKCSLNFK
jgi:hypothetical protein